MIDIVGMRTDVNFDLQTARVTSKPELGFYPKRWKEREVPIPAQLIELPEGAQTTPSLQARVSLADWQPRVTHAGPL